jgi:hypothetical protein
MLAHSRPCTHDVRVVDRDAETLPKSDAILPVPRAAAAADIGTAEELASELWVATRSWGSHTTNRALSRTLGFKEPRGSCLTQRKRPVTHGQCDAERSGKVRHNDPDRSAPAPTPRESDEHQSNHGWDVGLRLGSCPECKNRATAGHQSGSELSYDHPAAHCLPRASTMNGPGSRRLPLRGHLPTLAQASFSNADDVAGNVFGRILR